MKKGAFYLSLAVILYMVTFINNIPDYDLWARLAVGSIFFQIGHLFKHDIFSYLPTKDLWVDHEWGSSVVFYFFTRYFGEWGIFALNAIILSAIFILIIKIIKLQTDDEEAGIFYFTFLGFCFFRELIILYDARYSLISFLRCGYTCWKELSGRRIN